MKDDKKNFKIGARVYGECFSGCAHTNYFQKLQENVRRHRCGTEKWINNLIINKQSEIRALASVEAHKNVFLWQTKYKLGGGKEKVIINIYMREILLTN